MGFRSTFHCFSSVRTASWLKTTANVTALLPLLAVAWISTSQRFKSRGRAHISSTLQLPKHVEMASLGCEMRGVPSTDVGSVDVDDASLFQVDDYFRMAKPARGWIEGTANGQNQRRKLRETGRYLCYGRKLTQKRRPSGHVTLVESAPRARSRRTILRCPYRAAQKAAECPWRSTASMSAPAASSAST